MRFFAHRMSGQPSYEMLRGVILNEDGTCDVVTDFGLLRSKEVFTRDRLERLSAKSDWWSELPMSPTGAGA